MNWTAHPLGGAVIGKATDGYGRVIGQPASTSWTAPCCRARPAP